jgi:hypothetical protein
MLRAHLVDSFVEALNTLSGCSLGSSQHSREKSGFVLACCKSCKSLRSVHCSLQMGRLPSHPAPRDHLARCHCRALRELQRASVEQ